MSVPVEQEAGASDRAFALLQDVLPQQVLSKWMHRVARSTVPAFRTGFIRAFLRAYPTIDLAEAAQPDPYAYPSFNAFFTRSLRPGVRPLAGGDDVLVSPVDGTVSQLGTLRDGELLQAKGIRYSAGALLADESAAARYEGGPYACIYLAPYDYHRIHMPLAGQLRATRYVPGALYSVNASTSRAVPNLYTRNERVVCEFDTDAARSPSCWSGHCSWAASRRSTRARSILRPCAAARCARSTRASARALRAATSSAASTWARR